MKLFNSNEFCTSEVFKDHILCKKRKKKHHNIGDVVYVGYTCVVNNEEFRFVAPTEINKIEVIEKNNIKYEGKFLKHKQSDMINACNKNEMNKSFKFDESNYF